MTNVWHQSNNDNSNDDKITELERISGLGIFHHYLVYDSRMLIIEERILYLSKSRIIW